MNASAPGWLPDPSGRHEYRYWDGTTWTDDVSDAGTTSVDPAPGLTPPGGPGPAGDPTAVMDATQGYAPTAPFGTPTAPAGPGPADGYGQPAGYPAYGGTGPIPPAKPPRSGPSTGLLVGLGLLATALIVAIVVVLAGGDDGDGDGDETSASDTTEATETTEPDTPDTTAPADDGDTTDLPSDLGDIDVDDPEVREMIVDVVAEQFEDAGYTREQAECVTGAMLDGIGAERLAEIGESADMSSLTPEDMSSMLDAVTDCGLTDFPAGGTG